MLTDHGGSTYDLPWNCTVILAWLSILARKAAQCPPVEYTCACFTFQHKFSWVTTPVIAFEEDIYVFGHWSDTGPTPPISARLTSQFQTVEDWYCNNLPQLRILDLKWGKKKNRVTKQVEIETSWFEPSEVGWGTTSTAVSAGSQSLMAAWRSFKCPHFGCLISPALICHAHCCQTEFHPLPVYNFPLLYDIKDSNP